MDTVMEFADSRHLRGSLAVLVASSLALLLYRVVWLPYRLVVACKRQNIPFLPFRPLIGQIPELQSQWQVKDPISPATSAPLGPETVTPLLCDWISRFGTVFGFAAGPQPALVLADPDLVQQVLIGRSGCFHKMPAVQRALSFVGDGLPFVDGEEWLRQRKVANPSFSHGAIKVLAIQPSISENARAAHRRLNIQKSFEHASALSLFYDFILPVSHFSFPFLPLPPSLPQHALSVMNRQARKGVARLLQRIAQEGQKAEERTSQGGREVEIQEVLFAVTLDVIGFKPLLLSPLNPSLPRVPLPPLNPLRLLPTPENRTLWAVEQRFRQLFGELIARRAQGGAREGMGSAQGHLGKDILAALLVAEMRREEETRAAAAAADGSGGATAGASAGGAVLSAALVNRVVNQCATLIMAGHESVAVLVMWSMYLLARHPHWQHRLRSEVVHVVGVGGGMEAREAGIVKMNEEAEKDDETVQDDGAESSSSSSSSDSGDSSSGGGGSDDGTDSDSESDASSSDSTARARHSSHQDCKVMAAETQAAEAREADTRATDASRAEITWEQAGQLKDMHMVLLETLRLFPPVPVVTRTSKQDVRIGPYVIPKGVDLFLPVGCLHADERYWGPDAREFKPERFQDGQQAACSHPQAFIPFSSGPRDCVGAIAVDSASASRKSALAELAAHRASRQSGSAPPPVVGDDVGDQGDQAVRRKRRIDTFELKEEDRLYDVVDESEYQKIVAQRRAAGENFVVDDNGLGYADTGLEDSAKPDSAEAGQAPKLHARLGALAQEENASAAWTAVAGQTAVAGSAAVAGSDAPVNVEGLPLDADGKLPFFFLDAVEESYGALQGTVFLFGKVPVKQATGTSNPSSSGAYVSCCVGVQGMQRCVFAVPREGLFEDPQLAVLEAEEQQAREEDAGKGKGKGGGAKGGGSSGGKGEEESERVKAARLKKMRKLHVSCVRGVRGIEIREGRSRTSPYSSSSLSFPPPHPPHSPLPRLPHRITSPCPPHLHIPTSALPHLPTPWLPQELATPLKEEIRQRLMERHVSSFCMMPVKRSYAFERKDIPRGEQYVLKITYPYSDSPLPSDLTGTHFSALLGTHTRVEVSVASPKLVAPAAAESDPPPLVVASLNVKTVVNHNKNVNEVAAVSVVFCRNAKVSCAVLCGAMRAKTVVSYGKNANEFVAVSMVFCRNAKVSRYERELLSYLLARMGRLDADVIIGHGLAAFDLTVLLQRMQVGAQRTQMPKLGGGPGSSWGGGGAAPGLLSAVAGRLLIDTSVSSREILPKEVSHSLSALAASQLGQTRREVAAAEVPGMYGSSESLMKLVSSADRGGVYLTRREVAAAELPGMYDSSESLMKLDSPQLGHTRREVAAAEVPGMYGSSESLMKLVSGDRGGVYLLGHTQREVAAAEVPGMYGSSESLMKLTDAWLALSLMFQLSVLPLLLLLSLVPLFAPHSPLPPFTPSLSPSLQVGLVETDAWLALSLMFHLSVLPLSRQLTNLSGNLWNRTLQGSRAQRIEYLLLHEFHRRKFMLPDKLTSKEKEAAASSAATAATASGKKKKRKGAGGSGGEKQEKAAGGGGAGEDTTAIRGLEGGEEEEGEDEDAPEGTEGVAGGARGKKGGGGGGGGGGEGGKKKGPGYAGGLVLEPKRGLYDKIVALLDFNSLYPSIIREYNICFTTVACPDDPASLPQLPDPDPPGVLPEVLGMLVQRRRQVKDMLKRESDPDERQRLDIRQQALKLTANRVLSQALKPTANSSDVVAHHDAATPPVPLLPCFPASLPPLTAIPFLQGHDILQSTVDLVQNNLNLEGRDILQSTVDLVQNNLNLEVIYGDTVSLMINTALTCPRPLLSCLPFHCLPIMQGRDILQSTVDLVQNNLNLEVIYGDTDSIMINTGLDDPSHAIAIAHRVKKEVNKRYKLLEIEMDGLFRSMLLLNKKKYASVKLVLGPSEPPKVLREVPEHKGLDIVRRDWSVLSKEIGAFCLNQILSGRYPPKVLREVPEHKGLNIVRRDWSVLSKEIGAFCLNQILSGSPSRTTFEAPQKSSGPQEVLCFLCALIRQPLEVLREVAEHKLAARLRAGEVDLTSFVITKTLTKPPADYPDASSQPHVQVALRRKKEGRTEGCNAGDAIPYVIAVPRPHVQVALRRKEGRTEGCNAGDSIPYVIAVPRVGAVAVLSHQVGCGAVTPGGLRCCHTRWVAVLSHQVGCGAVTPGGLRCCHTRWVAVLSHQVGCGAVTPGGLRCCHTRWVAVLSHQVGCGAVTPGGLRCCHTRWVAVLSHQVGCGAVTPGGLRCCHTRWVAVLSHQVGCGAVTPGGLRCCHTRWVAVLSHQVGCGAVTPGGLRCCHTRWVAVRSQQVHWCAVRLNAEFKVKRQAEVFISQYYDAWMQVGHAMLRYAVD
ncbi:unnamed protein product [Closterium sp. Yama58-4]|nr:unnamed protein product [Closterium sp. Yama58-4]